MKIIVIKRDKKKSFMVINFNTVANIDDINGYYDKLIR